MNALPTLIWPSRESRLLFPIALNRIHLMPTEFQERATKFHSLPSLLDKVYP
jgi:hypothetical protein